MGLAFHGSKPESLMSRSGHDAGCVAPPRCFMGRIGFQELLLIALIVMVLFGGQKIPQLMKGLGQGIREFRKEMRGEGEPEKPAERPEEKPKDVK